MTHGDGQSMGAGPQGGGSRVGGRPIKAAVPQTGFLKEDDLTKTLGFQKSALWDGNFFGGRFVSGFRHSGQLLNFSLKKWSKTYNKTGLF